MCGEELGDGTRVGYTGCHTGVGHVRASHHQHGGYMHTCFTTRLHNSHIYIFFYMDDQLLHNKTDQRIFSYLKKCLFPKHSSSCSANNES